MPCGWGAHGVIPAQKRLPFHFPSSCAWLLFQGRSFDSLPTPSFQDLFHFVSFYAHFHHLVEHKPAPLCTLFAAAPGPGTCSTLTCFFHAWSWRFHCKTGTLQDSSCCEAGNRLILLTPSTAVPAPCSVPSILQARGSRAAVHTRSSVLALTTRTLCNCCPIPAACTGVSGHSLTRAAAAFCRRLTFPLPVGLGWDDRVRSP